MKNCEAFNTVRLNTKPAGVSTRKTIRNIVSRFAKFISLFEKKFLFIIHLYLVFVKKKQVVIVPKNIAKNFTYRLTNGFLGAIIGAVKALMGTTSLTPAFRERA